MKINLEFNNTTKNKFSKKFFADIAAETLLESGMECLEEKKIELSVALVDEKEISRLNFEYRKKNRPTDVLSFCEYEKKEAVCEDKRENIFLGELVVCPGYIAEISKQEKEPLEYSMRYIVSHGILHLLGFGHGKKMFSLQTQVADTLEIKPVAHERQVKKQKLCKMN